MKGSQIQIRNVLYFIMGFVIILCLVYIFFSSSYAASNHPFVKNTVFSTLKVDESAYGNTIFDTSKLDFRPVLDKDILTNVNNIISISFWVGGHQDNDTEEPIYDIALQDLEIDCNLLSPYLKWKLFKNGEELSSGSLDYKFDTIKNGRYVLTPIQQDLVSFNENKSLYDYYQFYMWLSDSCQEEDISLCRNSVDQSYLLNKKISGKIEVELYSKVKKELVRTPSDSLDYNTCIH